MTIRKETSYSRRLWPAPAHHRDAELRPPVSRPPSGPTRARTLGSYPMTPIPDQQAPAGQPQPTGDAAARDQVRQLHDQGAYRAIARTAGTGAMTIHDLVTHRSRPRSPPCSALARQACPRLASTQAALDCGSAP